MSLILRWSGSKAISYYFPSDPCPPTTSQWARLSEFILTITKSGTHTETSETRKSIIGMNSKTASLLLDVTYEQKIYQVERLTKSLFLVLTLLWHCSHNCIPDWICWYFVLLYSLILYFLNYSVSDWSMHFCAFPSSCCFIMLCCDVWLWCVTFALFHVLYWFFYLWTI